MSEERQETVADIVAAMRDESHAGDASFLEWVGSKMRSYADRIEAAEKREREAGAEAAQICGEIGEMVRREAACHQHVTDCHGLNEAAMREALGDVYNTLEQLHPYALNINDISRRRAFRSMLCHAKNVIDITLSAPPRNCNLGTTKEQSARFDAHCRKHMGCLTCPLREKDGGVPKHCEFA